MYWVRKVAGGDSRKDRTHVTSKLEVPRNFCQVIFACICFDLSVVFTLCCASSTRFQSIDVDVTSPVLSSFGFVCARVCVCPLPLLFVVLIVSFNEQVVTNLFVNEEALPCATCIITSSIHQYSRRSPCVPLCCFCFVFFFVHIHPINLSLRVGGSSSTVTHSLFTHSLPFPFLSFYTIVCLFVCQTFILFKFNFYVLFTHHLLSCSLLSLVFSYRYRPL